MSYSRWSSNDFQCDLYVYAHCDGGVAIHVAGNRVVYAEPLPPPVPFDGSAAWFARHQAVSAIIDRSERKPIGLPCDGEDYYLPFAEAASKVRELIAMGYHCDPSVADDIEADAITEEAP